MADRRRLPLVGDTRGVSEVVGFILVFGFLILALTLYQATVVPQQNAQTEFQHFEDVRNEMIELRNAVSTAGQADVSQFPSVTLGTNYRTRLLTINPPDPAGTLRTSESRNITISNESGSYINISTRFIEYQPGYNEISIGSTWLEHSVLYLDERDRGGVSIIEEQNIVKDGKVRITALQKQFQETGTGRVTLELYPEEEVNKSAFPNGNGTNLTVRVPTRLSDERYWNESLNDTGDMYRGVKSGRLNLSVNETDLEVNTVGIRGEPDEGPAKNTDPQGSDSSDNDDNGSGNGDGNVETGTGFESVIAYNIDDSTQSLEITLDGDLDDGESIIIDLSEAEQQNDETPPPAFVSYSGDDGDVIVTSGSGSSGFASYIEGDEAVVEYVSSGDLDGDTVELTVEGIDVRGGGRVGDLTAVFSRSDRTETAEDIFNGEA